jgi:hypothetical protein
VITDTNLNLLHELFPSWDPTGDINREIEMLELLGWELHFSATARYGAQEIIYTKSNAPVLRATFDIECRLIGLYAMAGLHEDDLQLIRDKFRLEQLETVAAGISREVWFNHQHPVQGWWRYLDLFQILPVPAHAPRHEFAMGNMPFLCEFRYDFPRNHHLNLNRRLSTIWPIHLVLNALLTSPITRWPHGQTASSSQSFWVMLRSNSGLPEWKIDYLRQCYHYKDFQDVSEGFSSVDEIPPISTLPANDYYGRLHGSCDPLVLPDDLGHSFDLFYGATQERREKILRCAFWINEMDQSTSASLKMICAVQAIDALLGEVPRGQRTAQFGEFLNQFAFSPAVSDAERRELFKIRSELSHGLRDPLIMDLPDYPYLHPLGHKDSRLGHGALSSARAAFYNWLHGKGADNA